MVTFERRPVTIQPIHLVEAWEYVPESGEYRFTVVHQGDGNSPFGPVLEIEGLPGVYGAAEGGKCPEGGYCNGFTLASVSLLDDRGEPARTKLAKDMSEREVHAYEVMVTHALNWNSSACGHVIEHAFENDVTEITRWI